MKKIGEWKFLFQKDPRYEDNIGTDDEGISEDEEDKDVLQVEVDENEGEYDYSDNGGVDSDKSKGRRW